MPFVNPIPGLAFDPFRPERDELDTPSFQETMGAAFRTENDVVVGTRMLTEPTFEYDPEFNVVKALEGNPLRFDWAEELGAAQNQEELDYKIAQIEQELADREILNAAGGWGFAAQIATGTLSPTMAIPGVGVARGGKAMVQAATLGAVAAGTQEAVLWAGQETRTPEEAWVSIGASTVLGGLLGGAIGFMPPRIRKKVESDMADSIIEEEVSYLAGEGSFGPVRPRDLSPRSSNLDLPTYVAGKTRVGDEVTVYLPDGRPIVAAVDVEDAAGGVTFKTATGEFVSDNLEVSVSDPRAPTAKLVTVDGSPTVAKLSNEELTVKADELEQSINTLKAEGRNADMLTRDRTALIAEALRRVQDDPGLDVPRAQGDVGGVDGQGQPVPRTPEQGEVQPVNAAPEPRTLQELADEAEKLPNADPPRQMDAPDGRSIGAAETRPRTQQQVARRGPISGWVLDRMSRLNPVQRVINQKDSAVASAWMARLSDAGTKTQGNLGIETDEGLQFFAHAPEGTVETRAQVHQAAVGEFIQQYDDAYVTHITGDLGDPDEVRSAFRATVAAGFNRLPEGKLKPEDFGKLVYEVGSTGKGSTDPGVMKAVAAQRKLFDYYKRAAAEAHAHRLTIDPEARPMFDPEGDLGPDVFNYIHQVYDTDKIVANSGEFKATIAAHAQSLREKSFKQAWTQMQEQVAAKNEQITEALQGEGALKQIIRRIDEDEARIANDPEMVAYETQLDDIDLRLRDAAGDAEEVQAIRKERDDLRMQRSDRVQNLEKQRRSLAAERRRVQRLQGMDKAGREQEAEALTILRDELEDEFDTVWREKGAVDLNVDRGIADFTEYGQEAAELLYNRMVGLGTRASGMEILGGSRGAELARTLNLPFADKAKWLNMDPEHTVRVYARHMSADTELYRASGSVNGATIFDEVREDFARIRQRLEAEGKTGKPLQDLLARQKEIEGDLSVVISRLRHQRGLPDNADGVGYRLGRAALDVNVARLMGNVVLSSIPDLARPVMRSGFQRTFGSGWRQMAGELFKLGATGKELRRIGIAWDPVMHNRTQAMFEMMDDYQARKTKLEKGLGFVANKTGLVAGFDWWTSRMKLVSGSVAASEFSHAIRGVVEGTADRRARELLAAHGIDDAMANRIWDQFNLPGGSSELVDGNRLPNMEAWDDWQSMMAYRAAIVKFTDDTIVTPGVDRPSWMDANIGFKLLAQFRSFTFASTNRVVMAGLQEQDRNLMQGIAFSLAMGYVSYYLYAEAVGGSVRDEARKMNIDKAADEAIARSGLLGIFGEAHKLAENIPALQPYTTFSGQKTSRRSSRSMMSALLGPTYGLTEEVLNVIQGMDEPTQSTLHSARKLVPYQNVFWVRQLLDQVEQAFADFIGLPERRSQ